MQSIPFCLLRLSVSLQCFKLLYAYSLIDCGLATKVSCWQFSVISIPVVVNGLTLGPSVL